MPTYYFHNEQIEDKGRCDCKCHQGSRECICGWLNHFPLPEEPRRIRIRSTKLTSRVSAFARKRGSITRITNLIYAPKEKRKNGRNRKPPKDNDKA